MVVATSDLEGTIRRIDGVLSCEMTETEVVVMLAEGAKAKAIGSLVSHLVAETSPGRVVRIVSVVPAQAAVDRPWALAGWILAGLLTIAAGGLLVALTNHDDKSKSTAAPPRSTTTTRERTTSTTVATTTTSVTTTTLPQLALVPATTTTTTTPQPAYAVQRQECRQDGTTLTFRGFVINESGSTHSYQVTVRFLNRAGRIVATGATDVPRVVSRERRAWTVQASYAGDLIAEGGSCRASALLIG